MGTEQLETMKSLLVFVMAASIAAPAMGQTETKPAPQTATVYVYRTKVRIMLRALRPSIYFDGTELRRLANGEYFSRELPTGKHMISAGRTEVGQLVDLEPGKEYFFKLDHKNVMVTWASEPLSRQPMTLTPVPMDQARREMDGLQKR
jgi:hypothetical protein